MLLFFLFFPPIARTQLPHVHDLTWFTNSAEALSQSRQIHDAFAATTGAAGGSDGAFGAVTNTEQTADDIR